MAIDDGVALDSVCIDEPASPAVVFNSREWADPGVQAELAASRKKVRRIVGTFLILSICGVVMSMVVDSYQSPKSEKILLREGNLEVSRIVRGPKNAGGYKALKKFVGKMVSLGEDDNATKTSDSETESDKGNSTAAAPSAGGESSKADKGEEEGEKSESPAIKTEPRQGNNGAPDEMEPGWTDKSGWDSGDWGVWILMGPCVTLAATMFMYYTYGAGWAIFTLGTLLGIDALAYYLNV
mmetsp:Transcript_41925/g.65518  ORF Transcript_41925/g.65518 Transcript_41925/m.65518 type:complete len:239 (-) Transcript_41925:152-868(-)|eukprot:CAMPEP_0184312374 /NCGR_PEP_ID=MMETSP1049-20130417/49547_1 /TAXON_ID=77928 /ORGANISM="Proteomonas sulcata, Strain CCMP704" /LENGTH=238 /DNA_ID=CAMNT_0026628473 /DNA_START=152 /DNA_END=868 /DNA_ORIENTATION=+